MRPLLAVALLSALLPGLLLWHQYRQDGHERALSAIASEVAGRPVEIRCQGFLSDLVDVSWQAGEVVFDHTGAPPDEATVKRRVCADIRSYPEQRERRFGCVHRVQPCPRNVARVAWAVHVLTHEAWHLRGNRDEATTECLALQTSAQTAQRLGATPEQGQALAAWAFHHAYPHLPSHYRSGECVDGGALDLRPETSVWP